MKSRLKRRQFIKNTAAGGLGLGLYPAPFSYLKSSPNEAIQIAIMGTNSRGEALAKAFAQNSDCHVAYICDVDEYAIKKGIEAVRSAGQDTAPQGIKDFRKALEDAQLDALVIAAPDHWHVPAAMLALQEGKHVYVEKPCSHNPAEGEMLVNCAKKHRNKVVMMGNQRRSWSNVIEAMNQLHSGIIGNVYLAKGWYSTARESMGYGKQVAVPSHLDFDLWQGPAPRRPYVDNIVHYNWHWRWHWGTGEFLNNGTHFIDLCRWGLGVDYPEKVSSFGGRYHFRDDWETPDTQSVTYQFPYGKSIFWESLSCNGRSINGASSGVSFHGEGGTMEIDWNSYKIYDLKNQLIKEIRDSSENTLDTTGPGFDLDKDHVINFVDAIKYGVRPRTEIKDANISVHICHLGNIAYRTGRSIEVNPNNGTIVNDPEAMQYWSREYEEGWRPII